MVNALQQNVALNQLDNNSSWTMYFNIKETVDEIRKQKSKYHREIEMRPAKTASVIIRYLHGHKLVIKKEYLIFYL